MKTISLIFRLVMNVAIQLATPTAAALLAAQLVGEPLKPNLIIGLVAVSIGIWIATTQTRVT